MKKLIQKNILVCIMIVGHHVIDAQVSLAPEFLLDQILINNIGAPWGMTFISANELLYTEKSGKMWRHNISGNTNTEITGIPAISQNGQGGLLDVALHPDFSTNGFVYLSYAVASGSGQTTALGRGRLVGNALQNFSELFRALPIVNSGVHFGSRIAFDKENFIYLSVGDRGTPENAQNINNHAGKVIRLKDDGNVPADNPLVGRANARPEIFSWGHRNVQGMAMNPASGLIYTHEHGPRGGDELNVLKKGANYGWPTITFGVNYNGTIVSEDTAREGLEQPITYWVPSIAPCGLAFIQSATQADEAEVLIGALAGTHLHWLKLKNNKAVRSGRNLIGYARFRDVEQAPDGKLYALTESPNRLIRIKPSAITATNVNTNSSILSDIQIFPNPTESNATLQISLHTSEQVTIKILGIDGTAIKWIQQQNLDAGVHQIELPSIIIPQGAYHIEITQGSSKRVVKWIKL
jgi:aldose sugar dehydrogenase